MAYDEELAGRIRALLSVRGDVAERKMFGGLCFLVGGNMACGLVLDRLMVRVPPKAYPEALKEPHVQPMDFTGRPLTGLIYVSPEGVRSESGLRMWVERGVGCAASLPVKAAKLKSPAKAGAKKPAARAK